MSIDFVRWLSRQLQESNISEESLAYRLGVSKSTISNLMNLKKKPTVCEVTTLCYVFGEEDIAKIMMLAGYSDERATDIVQTKSWVNFMRKHKEVND